MQQRQWQPTPVVLLGKIPWIEVWTVAVHGVGKSRTWLSVHLARSCIGEGNGSPIQCSGLENPRDGGAWWAALYSVAQGRAQLKWHSSSSSSSGNFYEGGLRPKFWYRKYREFCIAWWKFVPLIYVWEIERIPYFLKKEWWPDFHL